MKIYKLLLWTTALIGVSGSMYGISETLVSELSKHYRDTETGTFLTPDPLGFVDGPNVYTYVVQNPWTFFDPLGLYLEDVEDPEVEMNISVDIEVQTPQIDVKEPEPDYSFTPPPAETSPDESAKPDDFDYSKYRVPEGYQPREGLAADAYLEEIQQYLGLSESDLNYFEQHYRDQVALNGIRESLPMFILAWGGASAGNVRVGTGPRLNVSSPPVRTQSGTALNPDNFVANPSVLWGQSVDDISNAFSKNGYQTTIRQSTRGSQRAQIIEVKGHSSISQVQVHPGGGRHSGAYVKLSTYDGTIKVVNPNTYKPAIGEKATIVNANL